MKRLVPLLLACVMLALQFLGLAGCASDEDIKEKRAVEMAQTVRLESKGVFAYFLHGKDGIAPHIKEEYQQIPLISVSGKMSDSWDAVWCHTSHITAYGIDPDANYDLRGGRRHPLYEVYDNGSPITFVGNGIFAGENRITQIATSDPQAGSLFGISVGSGIAEATSVLAEYGFSVRDGSSDIFAHKMRVEQGDRIAYFSVELHDEELVFPFADEFARTALGFDGEFTVKCIGYEYETFCAKDGVACQFYYGVDRKITHISLYVMWAEKGGCVVPN